MRLRTFAFNAGLYSFIPFLQKLIGLLTVPVMTSILNPEEYGVILVIANTLNILTFVLNMGLDSALTIHFCQAEKKEEKASIASTVLFFRLATYLPLVMAVTLLAGYVEDALFPDHNASAAVQISIMGFFLVMLANHFGIILRCLELHKLRFYLTLAQVILQPAVTLYLVLQQDWRMEAVYMGTLLSNAVVLPWFLYYVRDYLWARLSPSEFKSMMRYGLPLIPAGLAFAAVQHTSGFFIQNFVSLGAAGLYTAAFSYASLLGILTAGFTRIWAPYAQNRFQEPGMGERFAQIHRLYCGILFLGTAFLALFSAEVIHVLMGEKFHDAYFFAPLIVTAQAVYTMADFFALGIDIKRQTKHRMWIGIIYSMIFLALAFPGTKLFGVTGLVICQILAYVVLGLLLQRVSHRLHPLPYDWKAVSSVWAIGIPLYMAGGLLEPSWAYVGIKAGLFAACCLLIIVFGLIRRNEIGTLFDMLIPLSLRKKAL